MDAAEIITQVGQATDKMYHISESFLLTVTSSCEGHVSPSMVLYHVEGGEFNIVEKIILKYIPIGDLLGFDWDKVYSYWRSHWV